MARLKDVFVDEESDVMPSASDGVVQVNEGEDTGPMAALGRVASMARVANMGPLSDEAENAKLAGMSLQDWRGLSAPSTGPMAALGRATERARDEAENAKLAGMSLQDWRGLSAPETATKPPAVTGVPVADKAGARMTETATPEAGSGGDDDELRRLYMAQLAARAAKGFAEITSGGRKVDTGIEDMLGARYKEAAALAAKRQEKGEELAREDAQSAALVQQYKSLAAQGLVPTIEGIDRLPYKQAASLIKTYSGLAGTVQRTEKTKAEIPLVQAKTDIAKAEPALKERGMVVKEKGLESLDAYRRAMVTQGLARIGLSAQQAEQKLSATAPDAKDIQGELKNIRQITQKGGYVPLAASLEQADEAIAALGKPPSAATQLKAALPGGDRFLSPQERAYYTAVDKLKQMEQLAISGKVVSVQERAEFLRQYGRNWYSNPAAAGAYIDLLREKTAKQVRTDLASVRATEAGKKALAAYEAEGGLTENAPVFKGKGAAARPVKPTAVPAGKTVLWNVAGKKWQAVPTENTGAAVASGKFEE